MGSKIGWLISTSGYSPAERERRLAQIRGHLPAGVDAEILTGTDAPEFLDDRSKFGDAVASSTSLIDAVDPEKYPVVVLAGAIDPGLTSLRSRTKAIVLGCAETSLFLAHQMGRKTAIVTVDEHAVAFARTMVADYKWADVVAIRSIGVPVRQIVSDGIEGEGFSRAREAIRREAAEAVAHDGADAIYLGAMTLASLGVADSLRRDLGVAVLDPMAIVLGAASSALAAAA